VDIIKESSSKKKYNADRMEAIGQNGNDGLHYSKLAGADPVEYVESEYPETAGEFKRIQEEQYKTFCKKHMDYGAGNISMGTSLVSTDERRMSLIGLIVRMNDKVQRLLNLVVKNNREAQNEPAIDAFADLSVYGIIAQIVNNKKWGR